MDTMNINTSVENYNNSIERKMNTSQFMKKQEKTVYSQVNTIIDGETGEVKEIQESKVVRDSSEPDFIKLYYKTFLSFNNINDIPLDFVLQLCEYIGYANSSDQQMTITVNKMMKENMIKRLNYKSISSIDKILKKCVSQGLLFKTQYRGVYVVNPFFIAKGSWNIIKKLQGQFDFVNGKWSFECTTTDENGDDKTFRKESPDGNECSDQ